MFKSSRYYESCSKSGMGGGGADKFVLLNLYRSLIRSKLDYGCIVYGSDWPSYIKMLNTVHHQGLRLALGAFRTLPVESLYVEAGELPLEHRRIKLSLQYVTKLKSTLSNPAFNCVFRPEYEQKYMRNTKVISPLGIRIKEHLEGGKIEEINDDDIRFHAYKYFKTKIWKTPLFEKLYILSYLGEVGSQI